MTELRLIQLADFDRPGGGSFLRLLRGVAGSAQERGWASECVFFESAREAPWIDELAREGIVVHLAPEELRGSDLRLGRWVSELCGEDGAPTILHSHFTGFDMGIAAAARGRPDLKVVWHLHGPLPRTPWHLARTAIKLGIVGRAVDLFLCPAQNIVEDAVARGAPRSRVRFFPSAIEPSASPFASPQERREARLTLGLAPEEIVLLHFGWHWKLKGGELFVRTLEELSRTCGTTVLGIERGGGAEYERLAEDMGISKHLRVLEPVPDAGLLHRAANLQLASSLIEGMAYGVLESLCVGTPVVATEIPGHAFLASHMDACRIARHDPRALATATTEMLRRDPERTDREARQAREWITANLSIEIVAEQMADLYEDLTVGRPLRLPWGAI